MAFAARFAGRCDVCQSVTTKSTLITKWGGKYAHVECAEAASAKAKLEAGETFRAGGSASAWQRKKRRNQSKYS
jgi:hypothetical protein